MSRDLAVTTGEIVKGRLKVRAWDVFSRSFARRRDCQVLIRVERVQANRSLRQLRFYWGAIVQALSEHTGFTPDEMHEVLKGKFLPKMLAITNGNGEIVGEFVIGGSTGKLTIEEMATYINDIQIWAASELGVVIPDPE